MSRPRLVSAAPILLLLLSPQLHAACTAPSFSVSPLAGATGAQAPTGIIAGDLTLAGRPTFYYTDSAAGQVAAYSRTATGLGGAASFGGSIPGAAQMTTGDFDRNGFPDIAFETPTAIYVCLHGPGGGFAFTTRPTSGSSTSVAALDFNGDGKLDLAVGDNGGGVSLYVGDGTGHFTLDSTFANGHAVFDLVAADMNADGRPDLVFSDLNGAVFVALAISSSTFSYTSATVLPLTGGPRRLVVGDFNEDGIMDIAVTLTTSGEVAVAYGVGTGTTYAIPSATRFPVGAGAMGIIAADVTGDGRADLIVTNATGNSVSVLPAVVPSPGAAPTFGTATTFPVGASPQAVAALDLDHDGRVDLVTTNFGGANLSLLHNDCVQRGGDANGDGAIGVSDVFYLINYLFTGGPPPAP